MCVFLKMWLRVDESAHALSLPCNAHASALRVGECQGVGRGSFCILAVVNCLATSLALRHPNIRPSPAAVEPS